MEKPKVTPLEVQAQVEAESKPQFDAILVHGYWMSEPELGDVRPALRSRLAVRAAALAYDHGKGAGKIVIDQGHLWGPNYPTSGSLMAKELVDKYGVSPEAIILREDSYSTGGEVKTFVELIKQNGWTNILDVAFSKHHLTISRIYDKLKTKVEFKSIEEIIEEKDNPHVKNLIKRFGKSYYEIIFSGYEVALWAVIHLPRFNYETFEQKNKEERTGKNKGLVLPMDVFKTHPGAKI